MWDTLVIVGAGVTIVGFWWSARWALSRPARHEALTGSAPDNNFVRRLRARLRRQSGS